MFLEEGISIDRGVGRRRTGLRQKCQEVLDLIILYAPSLRIADVNFKSSSRHKSLTLQGISQREKSWTSQEKGFTRTATKATATTTSRMKDRNSMVEKFNLISRTIHRLPKSERNVYRFLTPSVVLLPLHSNPLLPGIIKIIITPPKQVVHP